MQLVIEVDGEAHATDLGIEHDRARDQFLKQLGFQVLRIPGYDVIRDGSDVRERIWNFVREATMQKPLTPNPSPLRTGARCTTQVVFGLLMLLAVVFIEQMLLQHVVAKCDVWYSEVQGRGEQE